MSTGFPLPLLEPALGAALAAMSKLDEREIPAKLRVVASKQGQKLPPPLARALITELDESEWLRAKSLEQLPAGPSPARRLSELYLSRPEGWMDEAEQLVADWQTTRKVKSGEDLAVRLARAERRVEELSQRLQRELSKHRQVVARLEEEKRQAVAGAREGAEATRRTNEALRGQLAGARTRITELEASLETYIALMAELKAGGRSRPKAATAAGLPSGWSLRGRPERLAQHLDEISRALAVEPGSSAGNPSDPGGAPTVAVPVGVRPDRPEAIEWLRKQPARVLVVIDGWNVAYQMAGREPDNDTQRRVESGAERLGVGSKGFARVTVLYDSRVARENSRVKGVEIRYVPSADEEAIEIGRVSRLPVVVITSDRRVREAVEAHGGVGLWSEALVGWLQDR